MNLFTTNNCIVYFELNKFIDGQDKIWTKYDSIEQGLDLIKSEKDFINNFDRYIVHTLEEIYEVSEARDVEDMVEELIDVLMYLGTMYAIVRENAKLNFSDVRFKTTFQNELINPTTDTHTFEEMTSMILFDLMNIRRLFNKRKWHKYSEEMTKEQKLNAIDVMESKLRHSIKHLLSFILDTVFSQTNDFYNYVDGVLYNKQQFVINLQGKNE